MRRAPIELLAFGALFTTLGLVGGSLAVDALVEEEHVVRTPVRPVGDASGLLVRAPLAPGRSLLFEVCAEDAFLATGWEAPRFDVVFAHADGDPETALSGSGGEVRDAARHAPDGSGCATVARAEALPVEGEAQLLVRRDVLAEASLTADVSSVRVQGLATTWRPHGDDARSAAAFLFLGVLLLLVFAWLRPIASPPPGPATRSFRSVALGLVGAGLFLLFLVMLELVPELTGGSVAARGAAILTVQVALALALAQGVRNALALEAPPRGALWFGLSLVLGFGMLVGGRLVAGLVPSTGVAPVETLVAMPSGSVAFGLYALVAPLAEELFFRGFLYGAFERRLGANAATGLVVVLFALVHLAQSFGAWGAFLSVAMTGLVLTLLRRVSGSTLVPALAHVAHNGLLTWGALS